MSNNLTLPEEIDLVLKEIAEIESKEKSNVLKAKIFKDQNSWSAGYIPPYRASHINEINNTFNKE